MFFKPDIYFYMCFELCNVIRKTLTDRGAENYSLHKSMLMLNGQMLGIADVVTDADSTKAVYTKL